MDYQRICNSLFSPLAGTVLSRYPLHMCEQAREATQAIGDWYVTLDGVYLKIHGATKTPYLLPKFVLDRLFLMEIAHKMYAHGFCMCPFILHMSFSKISH